MKGCTRNVFISSLHKTDGPIDDSSSKKGCCKCRERQSLRGRLTKRVLLGQERERNNTCCKGVVKAPYNGKWAGPFMGSCHESLVVFGSARKVKNKSRSTCPLSLIDTQPFSRFQCPDPLRAWNKLPFCKTIKFEWSLSWSGPGTDPGFWSRGGQRSFDPKGPIFAQNMVCSLNIAGKLHGL